MPKSMPKSKSENPEKSKGLKVNVQSIFILFVFLLGILVGSLFTHQYIEPALYAEQMSDYNSTLAKNKLLDKQINYYVECMQSFSIEPNECKKLS